MSRLIFSMELFRYTFGTIFSLGKKIWVYRRFSMRFVEPATVVNVTYIDPGNWGPTQRLIRSSVFSSVSGVAQRPVYFQYLSGLREPAFWIWFKSLLAPPLAAVILATNMAEYMGLIIALHMLTGGTGSGGCICLNRRGPLGVAFRQTGPFFCEGCRAAVALNFVVELWLVRPPLWEAALPRLPEESAVEAAAVVEAATKPHALLLHSHLTHGMDRKTHMWQTLANLLGGLRYKRFNSDH